LSTIAENLAAIRGRIRDAARAAGRDPASVALVAVSKKKPAEAIREAYAAGHRAFGESYAQELDAKARDLADLADIEWHFIGHLQSNKAKLVAAHARVVHSIDGAGLARELGRRVALAGRPKVGALIEVSVAGEAQKHGAPPSELGAVIEAVRAEASLDLRGLMTMPPAGDLDEARRTFEALAQLRDRHGGIAALPELSMGMSDDLEAGVAAGATLVRVGSAIFGAR